MIQVSLSLSLLPYPSLPLSIFLSCSNSTYSQDLLSTRDVFTVAYRMRRAGRQRHRVPDPFVFNHECESSKRVGWEGQNWTGERVGKRARARARKHRFEVRAGGRGTVCIAEVGHHVNCIPDCGLLKSGALHRTFYLAPLPPSGPGADPKLDLTSQRPQPRLGLATGSPPPGTAGGYYCQANCPLVSRLQTRSVKIFERTPLVLTSPLTYTRNTPSRDTRTKNLALYPFSSNLSSRKIPTSNRKIKNRRDRG